MTHPPPVLRRPENDGDPGRVSEQRAGISRGAGSGAAGSRGTGRAGDGAPIEIEGKGQREASGDDGDRRRGRVLQDRPDVALSITVRCAPLRSALSLPSPPSRPNSRRKVAHCAARDFWGNEERGLLEVPVVDGRTEHVFPRSMGGPTDKQNVVTACWGCNAWKGDLTREQLGVAFSF